MTGFWRNWLRGWCWAVGLFGVVLLGGAFEATSGPTRLFFGVLQGPAELDLDAQMRFTLAVLGAVTLGWGLTLLAVTEAAHQLGAAGRPTWTAVTGAVAIWYLIDSGLSIATGYGVNALSNTIFLAAYLLPVLRSGVLARPV